jgi:hypothetical protein
VHGPNDSPKLELATGPQRFSWNKPDPFVVLLTRRGNGDEPAKRHSAPDTSGISHFAVIHNTGARADLRDNGIRSEGNIPEFTPASVRLSAAAQR